jgi:hypothetical protein
VKAIARIYWIDEEGNEKSSKAFFPDQLIVKTQYLQHKDFCYWVCMLDMETAPIPRNAS